MTSRLVSLFCALRSSNISDSIVATIKWGRSYDLLIRVVTFYMPVAFEQLLKTIVQTGHTQGSNPSILLLCTELLKWDINLPGF